MKSGECETRLLGYGFQLWNYGEVGSFHQQTLSHIALPAIGMRQVLDQRSRTKAAQFFDFRQLLVFGYNLPNSPHVYGQHQVSFEGLFTQVGRYVGAVLDQATVHVSNVNGSIGSSAQIDGAKAFIC